MRVIEEGSKELALMFPGVRQTHTGFNYREGRTHRQEAVMVPYVDSRKFELSDGSFKQDTLHVVVTEADGTRKRAGT